MRARRSSSTAAAVSAVAAALLVGACGHSAPRPPAPVRLSQLTPSSGIRVDAQTITVSGTVKPRRATVTVLGKRVRAGADGHFSTTVALHLGTNLIDVIAGAPHARAAMTALPVVRYALVKVPSVGGRSPRAAAAIISSAGLVPRLRGSGNPFSFLVPLAEQICGQVPAAGVRVAPGTSVTLSVGKVCI